MRISDWSSDVCSSDLGYDRAVDVEDRHLLGCHGAHQEEVVAEGRRHVGDLAGDGVEDAVPDEIEAEQLHQRHVERRDDDQHGGVVEEGSHDQVAELHENEDLPGCQAQAVDEEARSEEHTSELQSLMRISYAVFCLKKKKTH